MTAVDIESVLTRHRSAKDKLVGILKEKGIDVGFSIGVGIKGVEVRVTEDEMIAKIPKKVDGVLINTVKTELPSKRPYGNRKKRNAY